MKQYAAALGAAIILASCGGGNGGNEGRSANQAGAAGQAGNPNPSPAGTAAGPIEQLLRGPDGAPRGTVTVMETPQGLTVRVNASALPPGPHGAHLHAVGRCDPPDFKSAGPHWNPTNNQHGTENPQGPHMGDLPNLMIAGEGTGNLEFTVPRARLRGAEPALLDGDGAALVIHAKADDYRTDPSGESGDRIACAVLR